MKALWAKVKHVIIWVLYIGNYKADDICCTVCELTTFKAQGIKNVFAASRLL